MAADTGVGGGGGGTLPDYDTAHATRFFVYSNEIYACNVYVWSSTAEYHFFAVAFVFKCRKEKEFDRQIVKNCLSRRYYKSELFSHDVGHSSTRQDASKPHQKETYLAEFRFPPLSLTHTYTGKHRGSRGRARRDNDGCCPTHGYPSTHAGPEGGGQRRAITTLSYFLRNKKMRFFLPIVVLSMAGLFFLSSTRIARGRRKCAGAR